MQTITLTRKQIKRFLQSFAKRTGRNKSSSYHSSINLSEHFDENDVNYIIATRFDDNDVVYVEAGDVGDYNRTHIIETISKMLLNDFAALVDEADRITKNI